MTIFKIPPVPQEPIKLTPADLDDGFQLTDTDIAAIEPWQPMNIIEPEQRREAARGFHEPDNIAEDTLAEMDYYFPTKTQEIRPTIYRELEDKVFHARTERTPTQASSEVS